MNSQERVRAVIAGQKPDRIPIHGWIFLNMKEAITARFGSVEAFEDKYEFDLAHLWGGPSCWIKDDAYWVRKQAGAVIEPPEIVDLPLNDPCNEADYAGLRELVRHHKEERGRFVYVQTPGIFEKLNGTFGIENHLAYLLEFPDELKEIYHKQAEWNQQFAGMCLQAGVDMIHVSDDWGSQRNLLMSPDTWWELIYPCHKRVADHVKSLGGLISLHSDGDINLVVDGIKDIGYNVVHPWQESAGMSYEDFLAHHRSSFSIMSGYDVQTTLGFGRLDEVRKAADRVIRLFNDGGLLFNTTHYVQKHCSIDELVAAFDYLYERVRGLGTEAPSK
jgi:uroporphyrinogen decarboxylase